MNLVRSPSLSLKRSSDVRSMGKPSVVGVTERQARSIGRMRGIQVT